MEFILNNQKFAIVDHELYINYLMVDAYFKSHSKYDYDIGFEFLNPIYEKEKVEFEDILEGTQLLKELIEREEITFIPYGLRIDQHLNENFKITYQDLEFININVGEAIPLVIALNALLNAKPTVSLAQIKEELDHFLEKFRSYANQ